ncbi:Flp pilus assembly protein CpaB [Thalassobacillus devorans]|uniref:Flp pilus assembly protein CpaB n=1 Tax=Thalassobacillus devorans TaxID=279813 RepID=UPI0004BC0D09|nr:Flp pilus assembly protein CpaB [Thalassobacillus devorans]
MKTKKLWIWSLLFGIIATAVFYGLLNAEEETSASTGTEEIADGKEDEQEDKKQELEESVAEGETVNKMLSVEKGKRAMTVQIEEPQGVAGFIEAGDHVDVVAILTAPEEAKDDQHDAGTLILQNVQVLAVGHSADTDEEKARYQMVTLSVTPKEGLTLGFATKYQLYLMLRSEGDDKVEPKNTHIHEDNLHKGVFK